VSSIRLFILGSLDERGPMHGHGLRLLAEEEHIDQWTDFTVGAVYGAIKRLAAEDLIAETRVERQGNYPERQVYAITDAGRDALDVLRSDGLSEIVIKPDPFDLAFARLDAALLDDLPQVIELRIRELRAMVEQGEAHHAKITRYLTVAERWSLGHQLARVRAELAWHQELMSALPDIIDDERNRKDPR